MIWSEIVYTAAAQPGLIRLLPALVTRQDGLGWAYHLVMTATNLRKLIEKWNTRGLRASHRRLAKGINQSIKAYLSCTVGIEELPPTFRARISISLLLQDGWRIRQLADRKSIVLESN